MTYQFEKIRQRADNGYEPGFCWLQLFHESCRAKLRKMYPVSALPMSVLLQIHLEGYLPTLEELEFTRTGHAYVHVEVNPEEAEPTGKDGEFYFLEYAMGNGPFARHGEFAGRLIGMSDFGDDRSVCACKVGVSIAVAPDPCCARVAGYYCDYWMAVAALEFEEWVPLADLWKLMRLLRYTNFLVQSSRTEALQQMAALKAEAPFGHCRRFPCDQVYVNWTCSLYNTKVKQLVMALNTKDREKEKQSLANPSATVPESTDSRSKWSSDDALVSFHEAVASITASMCKREAFFDRHSFERRYGLRWCVGACPECIDPIPAGEIPTPTRPPGTGRPQDPDDPDQRPPGRPVPNRTFGAVRRAFEAAGKNPDEYMFFDGLPFSFHCGDLTRKLTQVGDSEELAPAGNYFFFNQKEITDCPNDDGQMVGYEYDPFTAAVREDTQFAMPGLQTKGKAPMVSSQAKRPQRSSYSKVVKSTTGPRAGSAYSDNGWTEVRGKRRNDNFSD